MSSACTDICLNVLLRWGPPSRMFHYPLGQHKLILGQDNPEWAQIVLGMGLLFLAQQQNPSYYKPPRYSIFVDLCTRDRRERRKYNKTQQPLPNNHSIKHQNLMQPPINANVNLATVANHHIHHSQPSIDVDRRERERERIKKRFYKQQREQCLARCSEVQLNIKFCCQFVQTDVWFLVILLTLDQFVKTNTNAS